MVECVIEFSKLKEQLMKSDAPKCLLSLTPYIFTVDITDLQPLLDRQDDQNFDGFVRSNYPFFNPMQLAHVLKDRHVTEDKDAMYVCYANNLQFFAIRIPCTVVPVNFDDLHGYVHMFLGYKDNTIKALNFVNRPGQIKFHFGLKFKTKCRLCGVNGANVYFNCRHAGFCFLCAVMNVNCPVCFDNSGYIKRILLHKTDDLNVSTFVNQPCGHVSRMKGVCEKIHCFIPTIKSDKIFYSS